MADFRTHVGVAATIGIGYGFAVTKGCSCHLETSILAATLTTVGGMLPDLDSDSGRPVREVFGLAAAALPLLASPRFVQAGLSHEGVLTGLVLSYVVIRYGAAWVLKRISVHRGMWHSIPAMLIFGLVVYLGYGSDDRITRAILAVGVMLGFLSHLVLDEIYSVDFNGVRLKLKSSSGSAVKMFSDSVRGTTICYTMLGALLYLGYLDWETNMASTTNANFVSPWHTHK